MASNRSASCSEQAGLRRPRAGAHRLLAAVAAAALLPAIASAAPEKPETGTARPGGGAARPSQAELAPRTPNRRTVAILPGSVTLSGPKAFQQLVVEVRGPGGWCGDVTARARFRSSNPAIATVDANGVVRPVADGVARIRADVDGRSAWATVRVRDTRQPFVWSFANHVIPVLTKAGCNSGACHGASAGKGGLKLTLRGFDPAADHATLTRQALARRIVPEEPERSLVLRKPTMALPHGGGRRLQPGSREYHLLLQWIRAGCPPPTPSDPKLVRLVVLPPEATLRPGQEQQIVAQAVFSDGRVEDVTRWVKYGTSDDGVAAVDEDGKVVVRGRGEAAITLWYLNRVAFARITSPFPNPPLPATAGRERRNFVDDRILARLAALRIPPAALCSDETFVRRAYLDAIGTLPTPEEAEAFLAECEQERRSAAPGEPAPVAWNARARLVERLLARPEFVDYWAYKWSDLLLVSSRRLPSRAMWAFYRWIRESVAENKPWDRFVFELLTATGSNLQHGAANYFVLHKDPIDLTETTSQAFLGMSLTCARCHNHPLEKWTLNDYYGMANLFARVRLKNGDQPGETLVFAADEGDVPHIRTGMPVPPRPLDAPPLPADFSGDRRVPLARWLTAPENPYFARALVNRVWRHFMGRGLVEPEDDLRLTNPASNEELLAELTQQFVRHGFDIRWLIATVMNSAAYHRASVPAPGAPADLKYHASYIPRRLPAEVLLDALSQVTGIPTEFPGYPRGTRALQLPDSQVTSYFLTAFGRPPREQTCSCERQEEPNLTQALHLSNGETINGKLRARGGTVDRLLEASLPDEALLERLYRLVFSRRPTPEERARVLAALGRFPSDGRREAIEDLLAAMLTTKEFLFNH